MKIKTLPKLAREILTIDPLSAISESFIAFLAHINELPHTYHGNRLVADAEALAPTLNHLFGFEENGELPHIRSIRDASEEIKKRYPDIGIGEKRIRQAVRDGRIASVSIGNRKYIALESFDEPYCGKLLEGSAPKKISRTEKVRSNVLEQVAQTIASSAFVPNVTRASHSL